VARQQVRFAYEDTQRWRLETVLSDIEDEIELYLHRIDAALEDDAADREESGEAERQRQAWLPLRVA
jgi:hypothetical protein